MRHRVVVTGIGTISGVGRSDRFLQALKTGAHGFSVITDHRLAHLKANHVALSDLETDDPCLPPLVRAQDRIVHLAYVAMLEALREASVVPPLGSRGALVLGTCSGGMRSIERHYEAIRDGENVLNPQLLFSKRYYATARVLAHIAGASGVVATVVTACAAGAGAIGEAANLIRYGLADIAVAGGADSFAPSTLLGFDALKATCDGICTPFSGNIGLNLGEGAGMLVLESLTRARARNATILAELLGSGLSNDAHHPTSPDPSCKAQIAALRRTLEDAGVGPETVDYINAHGTGTRANDAVESRTIQKVFGARSAAIPVSSTKSLIGHCLGAAGALETAAVVLAARAGVCPPTAGFDGPREGCALDYVPDIGRPFPGTISLTNSFGFGGNNACLLIDTAPDIGARNAVVDAGPRRRVLITGMGVVHPLGVGLDLLRTGASGIARASDRFPNVRPGACPVGFVPNIDARVVDRRLDLRGMGALARYATIAARAALLDGDVKCRPVVLSEVGAMMGLSAGDTASESAHLTATFDTDFHLDRVESFPFVVQNAAAGQMAAALMLKGPSSVLSTGWGAGLTALVFSVLAIETGHAETLLAMGCDVATERSLSDGLTVGLFGPAPAIVPGEGAAALLLEHTAAAESRAAPAAAEILGFGMAADVADPMAASGEAASAALDAALRRAGISPGAVSAIALSGSEHPVHRMEQSAANALLPVARGFSLYSHLGFPEAALPLLGLSHLIDAAAPGECLAALSLSLEGIAAAVVARRL